MNQKENQTIVNKGTGYMLVPREIGTTNTYNEWIQTAGYRYWSFLYFYIVRAPQHNKLGDFLYQEFYLKGKLPSRFSLEEMGGMFGKNKGTISRHIKDMADINYLKIEKVSWYGNLINVYDFGTHDGDITMPYWHHEKLFAFNEIAKKEAQKTLDKFR